MKLHRLVYVGLIIGMLIILVDGPHSPIPAIALEIAMIATLPDMDVAMLLAALGIIIVQVLIFIFGAKNLLPVLNRIILSLALLSYNATLISFGLSMDDPNLFFWSASLLFLCSAVIFVNILQITFNSRTQK